MPGMNSYSASGTPQGGSMWAPPENMALDINQQGASSDPFAYTEGSLLTPWQGRFNSSGYGGGYSAPAFTPFNYADFDYAAPQVGQFEEKYEDPAAFRFADFAGPKDFAAPTAEDMKMDPGYQARMDAVKNAQVAGAAHGGVLRSGGFQKGLAQAVGNQASQEYGNVYNRRASEHDRLRREGESNYTLNQGNTYDAFNTNVKNKYDAYGARQGAWSDNANIKLKEGELGYNIATGKWDRNYGKARTGWEDQQRQNEAVAAAGNANASARYGNDLADYTRARDEFWTNQDRQYAILDREDSKGYGALQDYAGAAERAYGGQADYTMGAANARAAGTSARGAAYGSAFGDAADTMSGYGMYGSMYGQQPASGGGYRPPSIGVTSGIPGGRLPGQQMPLPQAPTGPGYQTSRRPYGGLFQG